MITDMAKSQRNPYVEITGIVSGISIAIVAVSIVLGSGVTWTTSVVIALLVFLGITLGYFQYNLESKK